LTFWASGNPRLSIQSRFISFAPGSSPRKKSNATAPSQPRTIPTAQGLGWRSTIDSTFRLAGIQIPQRLNQMVHTG
jgi:hypothetical protein